MLIVYLGNAMRRKVLSGQLGRLHVPDELQHNVRDNDFLRLSFRNYFEKLTIDFKS